MADGPEVGTAYISLLPSAKGFAGAIGAQIGAPVEAASIASGKTAGGGMATAFTGAVASKVGGTGNLVKALGLVGLGAAAFSAAEDVEGALNTIVRATGATGAKVEGLEDSFKKVASGSAASFDTIASTLSEVFQRTGLTGDGLEKLTSQVVTFNRITKDSPIEVQELTKALAGFGVPADQMSAQLDKLFVTSQRTGVPLADLISTIDSAGPIVRQFGIPVEQAAGLLAELNKGGLDGSQVMAGLRKAMISFAKDAKDPGEALRLVVAQMQQMIATGDILGARQLAVQLFGARGAGLVDAVTQGKLSLETLNATFDSTGKGILDTASSTATLGAKMAVLKNNAKLALAEVGGPLLESAIAGMQALLPVVQGLTLAFTSLPSPVRTGLVALVAIGLVAGPVAAIGASLAGLIPIVAALGGAFLTLLPFIAIAVAIAAAAFLIFKNWDAIADFFVGLWDGIKSGAASAWDAIVSTVTGATGKVGAFLSAAWTKIQSTIVGVFTGIAGFFGRWWKTIVVGIFTGGLSLIVALVVRNWDKIKAVTIAAFNAVVAFLAGLPARIIAIFQTIYEGTVAVFSSLVAFIAGVPGQIIGILSSLISAVPGIFSAAWQGAVDATVSIGGAIIGFVAGLPGQILGALGDIGGILFDAGSSIISGLLSGIQSAVGSVFDFVRNIPGQILDIVKGGIGFGSPARKFIPLGLSIPQGIAVGMLSGKPLVDAATAGILPSGSVKAPAVRAFTTADRAIALQPSATAPQFHTHFHDLQVRGEQDLNRIDKIVRAAGRDNARGLRARGSQVGLQP